MEDVFKKRFGRYFHGFSKQIINKRRLDTLLKQYNIKDIDILSIDVEGYEAQVLSGIDFKIYRPKVLIIEALDKERENNLDDILLKQGYHKSVKIKANILYIIDIVMEQTIKNKTFQVSVIHTQHPLDDNGDSIRKCTINS